MTDPTPIRLVTFLGTGQKNRETGEFGYAPVIYRFDGRQSTRTPWISRALCEVLDPRPTEVVVLATPTARTNLGDTLLADLAAADTTAELRMIDEGGEPDHLWQQFEAIKTALRAPPGCEVVLDITHGYRSQPFFAAAVVAFVRAVDDDAAPLRVVYGGFEARDAQGIAPVWELTGFVDLVDTAREIMLFLKTGRVAGVADLGEHRGRQLARDWARRAKEDRGPRPTLDSLSRALGAFGRDLETVRTGALLLGDGRRSGSARRLAGEIEEARNAVAGQLPPLADVLDRIAAMAEPLAGCAERLNTREGHAALASLANLYLTMGRYSEAATTVREGLVTLYADDAAACPGLPQYSPDLREQAERAWQTRDRKLARRVAQPRNDIDHGGYRLRPLPAIPLADRIAALAAEFEAAKPNPAPGCAPVFANISNHPTDAWEEAQRAAALALAPHIVDVAFPDVPPEADAETVARLADETLAAVPEGTTHAMVQGEFTLAFALVRELQRRGVCCYAATSDRDVDEGAPGEQVRRFSFVAFRPYPS